jgi:hypothetical protein
LDGRPPLIFGALMALKIIKQYEQAINFYHTSCIFSLRFRSSGGFHPMLLASQVIAQNFSLTSLSFFLA